MSSAEKHHTKSPRLFLNPRIIIVLLPVLVPLYFVWWLYSWASPYGWGPLDSNSFDNLSYDWAIWLEDRSCVDGMNRRGSMAMDIRRRFLNAQATEAALERELGPPWKLTYPKYRDELSHMEKTYFNDIPQEKHPRVATVFTYYLGEEQNEAWGIDRANLYLFFDREHHYLGCRIGWL
jgi:hypothetical protein